MRERKNRWSNRVPRTTSPIFNQSTSEILLSDLHLIIYYTKQAYEFVCYIGYCFSQKKEGNIYFVSDFLLVMVKHILIFNIFISFFYILYYLMK